MEIIVKHLNGRTFSIQTESSCNIEKIKEEIYKKEHILPEHQCIVWTGTFPYKELVDSDTLIDNNIQNESTLNLVMRLPGSLI